METPYPRSPLPTSDSMQHVIADVNRFLVDWLQRFERMSAETVQQPDQELLRQIEEFETCREEWERQRNAEQDNLEQSAQDLTDAWLRLEDQQRELMRCGTHDTSSSSRPSLTTFSPPHSPPSIVSEGGGPNEPLPAPTTGGEPVTPTRSVPVASHERVAIPTDGVSRDVALRQFEKLKHQIASARQ